MNNKGPQEEPRQPEGEQVIFDTDSITCEANICFFAPKVSNGERIYTFSDAKTIKYEANRYIQTQKVSKRGHGGVEMGAQRVQMAAQRVQMGAPRETKNETMPNFQTKNPTDSKSGKYVKNKKRKSGLPLKPFI